MVVGFFDAHVEGFYVGFQCGVSFWVNDFGYDDFGAVVDACCHSGCFAEG